MLQYQKPYSLCLIQSHFLVSNISLRYNYFKSCISYNHYQKAFDILSEMAYTFCSE